MSSWLEYATYIVGGGALEPACRTLNEALSMRTFLAGYSLSVADMAIWGQLQGRPSLSENHCNIPCTFMQLQPEHCHNGHLRPAARSDSFLQKPVCSNGMYELLKVQTCI